MEGQCERCGKYLYTPPSLPVYNSVITDNLRLRDENERLRVLLMEAQSEAKYAAMYYLITDEKREYYLKFFDRVQAAL